MIDAYPSVSIVTLDFIMQLYLVEQDQLIVIAMSHSSSSLKMVKGRQKVAKRRLDLYTKTQVLQ